MKLSGNPNIVFINTDQQHFEALSAYGNPYVKTPHMDRLVKEGYSFRKMHAVMPMCVPARTSWMTGRTSEETGVVNNPGVINPELPDLAQWLRRHTNYETVHTGKWHVNGRSEHESFDRVLVNQGSNFGEITDFDVGRSAANFIKNRESKKPYFLMAGLLNPHDPRTVPEQVRVDREMESARRSRRPPAQPDHGRHDRGARHRCGPTLGGP